ncbi:MAG: glycosyltransferase family 39 protein [Pleurocapsa minor GSE-CHR-MK-17-07R]|nr:glycosyltransferase family 39 protein [Pleurocapsa minor GSE-CHR-MK 17-07R]
MAYYPRDFASRRVIGQLPMRVTSISRPHLWIILAAFVLSRVIVVASGVGSMAVLESVEGPEYTHLLDGGPALDMFYRQDAGFYATIATEGYDWFNDRAPSADMVFWPLYPALTRLASGISGQGCVWSPYLSTCATIGGLIVSNLALLASCFVLYDLARRVTQPRTALIAVLFLLAAPNAIFLSGVYTESLFLLLVLLTFWLAQTGRFAWAILPAVLACLTRSVGVALIPALLYLAWQMPREKRILSLLLACLPGLAFVGYIAFAGLWVGDLGAYFSAYEGVWGRSASVVDVVLVYFREPVALLGWYPSWFDLAFALGYLALALATLFVWKQRAWGLFALFALLIPVASGSLLSMPRFGAVIFPFYILLALWANRPWKQLAVALPSIALALLILSRFVTWRWIA